MLPLKPQVILFDFDGTLVDSFSTIVDCYNEIAPKYKARRVTKNDFSKLMNKSPEEAFKELNIGRFTYYFIIAKVLKRMRCRIKETPLFDNMKKLLETLKESGCLLGILSSNSLKNITRFLDFQNLHCFDHIYCSGNLFGKDKLLKKFMKKFNLNNDEILYVGDELRDIEACRKTGIPIISVTWGYNSREVLTSENPHFLAHDVMDILKFVHTERS